MWSTIRYPSSEEGGISPGEKWWQTVLETKVACSQWKAQHALMRCPIFFFLRRGEGFFFCFFPCSHLVPYVFPLRSQSGSLNFQVVLQKVPNSSSLLSHIVCPKFNSHVYKQKSWAIASTFDSILPLEVKRDASIGRHAQMFPKICWWVNQYGSFKKRENVMSAPMNYN